MKHRSQVEHCLYEVILHCLDVNDKFRPSFALDPGEERKSLKVSSYKKYQMINM